MKKLMARLACGLARRAPEVGQVLFQTAIGLPILLIVVGLSVDGGLLFVNYRRAQAALDLAAHAASHAIDAEHFFATQEVRLDPGLAYETAQRYARLNSRGAVSVTGVYLWPAGRPERIIVTGTAHIPTAFWRLAGINAIQVRLVGTARPRAGIEREGQ